MNKQKNVINTICEAKSFLVITHVRPDGDAISSSIAMYYLLVDLGKKAEDIDIFIPYVSKDLSFIDKDNIITSESTIKEYDLVIIVDCPDSSMVEGRKFLETFSPKQCILIDHHEESKNPIKTDYSVIDTFASSCTSIIHREFYMYISEQNRYFFNRCIAIGIMSDTIGLTLNATEECKEILIHCKQNGVDIQKIAEKLNSIDERTQLLTNKALKRLVVKQGIGCTYIIQSDLTPDEYSLKTVNHKAIIQQILDSVSCNTFILLIENDSHELKGSMRTSASNVDLNQICASMVEQGYFVKGGGHSNSAGFTKNITDTTPEMLKCIFDHLIKVILDK